MKRRRGGLGATLGVYLLILSVVPAPRVHAAGDVRGLISACADGDLEMCRQLEQSQGELSTGSALLDERAAAFARHGGAAALQRKSVPSLREAYPLIINDYFEADTISEEQRHRWLQTDLLPACAQHYADTWLSERAWWPVDSRGDPDWQLIYVHVLDHYFGYCVR